MERFEYDHAAWEADIDRRVKQFNSSRHSFGPGGDCPICNGSGLIYKKCYELNSHYVRVVVCDCVELERQKERLQRCGMPELLRKHSLDNFQADAPWQKELLEAVKSAVEQENWVLLCGQSGCGKTHLAAALCRELICRGQRVYCISWPETARKLATLAQDYDRREAALVRLREEPVLLIDDLFKTRRIADGLPEVGKSEMDLAFEVIDHRYRTGKRTILTTELRPSQLSSLNEAVYGRIKERCGACVKTVISARDRDWRTKLPS